MGMNKDWNDPEEKDTAVVFYGVVGLRAGAEREI